MVSPVPDSEWIFRPRPRPRKALEVGSPHTSSLELASSHVLWMNNLAGASKLWPISFLALDGLLHVISTLDPLRPRYLSAILPDEMTRSSPRSEINFLRVGTMNGREVVGIVAGDGSVSVWRTLSIFNAVSDIPVGQRVNKSSSKVVVMPWYCTAVEDSCWGLAFHPDELLLVTSDNSGTVTLHVLGDEPSNGGTLRSRKVIQRRRFPGNIPSVEFIIPDVSDSLEVFPGDNDDTETHRPNSISIAVTTLRTTIGTGGDIAVWKIPHEKVFGPDIPRGKLVASLHHTESGWCVKAISQKAFLRLEDSVENFTSESSGPAPGWSYVPSLDDIGLIELQGGPTTPQWLLEQPMPHLAVLEGSSMDEEESSSREPLLLNTLKTTGFLFRSQDLYCRVSALESIIPVGWLETYQAISIVEVIEPLSVVILGSRSEGVHFMRLVQSHDILNMRQEFICIPADLTTSRILIGITSQPWRSQDIAFELQLTDSRHPSEALRGFDLEDTSVGLGSQPVYTVYLHFQNGEVVAFAIAGTGDLTAVDQDV